MIDPTQLGPLGALWSPREPQSVPTIGARSAESRRETATADLGQQTRLAMARNAFADEFPNLQQEYADHWVAYQADVRVAISPSHAEIDRQCAAQGFRANDLMVWLIKPAGGETLSTGGDSQAVNLPLDDAERRIRDDWRWARQSKEARRRYAGELIAVHNREVLGNGL